MDSSAIFPLPVNDYPDHTINKRDPYNMVYNFQRQNNPRETDASQLLKTLFGWKDANPIWIIKPRLESVSRNFKSYCYTTQRSSTKKIENKCGIRASKGK